VWDLWPLIIVLLIFVRTVTSRRQAARYFRATGPAWRRAYSRRAFLRLGGFTVLAGALAFSGADETVESWHASNVRSTLTDRLAFFFKLWGERIWFAIWGVLAAIDVTVRSSFLTTWGRRTFTAMMVGLPQLWTLQRVLGGTRPSADQPSPRWDPFATDRAASGHTFVAAIPWLTLARQVEGQPARGLALGASLLTGWSRLNDRMHYPSQIVLGYGIAWNAASAVAEAETEIAVKNGAGPRAGAADGATGADDGGSAASSETPT
jgi:membrane-associated phospholipid phosphatase